MALTYTSLAFCLGSFARVVADTPAWCVADAHGYNCEGNTVKTVTGITAHIDCCNACTDYGDGCQAWTWHFPDQTCMLKSVCNNVTSSDDYHTSWPRGGPTPPPSPSPPTPPTPPPGPGKFFGSGKVQNKAFWANYRGIGFSPADDRGPGFSKEHPPQLARLYDALAKVTENGFNFIRTWHTNDYQALMLQHIRDQKLDLKVQLGVDISNDAQATGLIDQAAQVAMKYPELVLSLSIGNENIQSSSNKVPALSALKHANYAKQTYGVPVTYDFEGSYKLYGDAITLCKGLDYISVHSYGSWFQRRYDSSYTPDAHLAAVLGNLQDVHNRVGYLGKPVVLGETGWQSRMFPVASVAGLQQYYNLITNHVYKTRDANIQSMAFFELNDEQWKGGDDAWGLYEQGTASSLGAPKFQPINVDQVLALGDDANTSSSRIVV